MTKKLFTIAFTLAVTFASAPFATAQNADRGARPQRPNAFPMGVARTDDGRIDLSKLPDQIPQERKDAFKAADKDKDGFLSREELRDLPRPEFQFIRGQKPEFLNDDNAFIVDKTIEAIKAADKNNDGIIDKKEQQAVAELLREKNPMLPRFIALVLGDTQARFGAFNSDRPGQTSQRRPQGNRAQGDRPQGNRAQGDRPQGNRAQGDRPQGNRSQDRRAPQ